MDLDIPVGTGNAELAASLFRWGSAEHRLALAQAYVLSQHMDDQGADLGHTGIKHSSFCSGV